MSLFGTLLCITQLVMSHQEDMGSNMESAFPGSENQWSHEEDNHHEEDNMGPDIVQTFPAFFEDINGEQPGLEGINGDMFGSGDPVLENISQILSQAYRAVESIAVESIKEVIDHYSRNTSRPAIEPHFGPTSAIAPHLGRRSGRRNRGSGRRSPRPEVVAIAPHLGRRSGRRNRGSGRRSPRPKVDKKFSRNVGPGIKIRIFPRKKNPTKKNTHSGIKNSEKSKESRIPFRPRRRNGEIECKFALSEERLSMEIPESCMSNITKLTHVLVKAVDSKIAKVKISYAPISEETSESSEDTGEVSEEDAGETNAPANSTTTGEASESSEETGEVSEEDAGETNAPTNSTTTTEASESSQETGEVVSEEDAPGFTNSATNGTNNGTIGRITNCTNCTIGRRLVELPSNSTNLYTSLQNICSKAGTSYLTGELDLSELKKNVQCVTRETEKEQNIEGKTGKDLKFFYANRDVDLNQKIVLSVEYVEDAENLSALANDDVETENLSALANDDAENLSALANDTPSKALAFVALALAL